MFDDGASATKCPENTIRKTTFQTGLLGLCRAAYMQPLVRFNSQWKDIATSWTKVHTIRTTVSFLWL